MKLLIATAALLAAVSANEPATTPTTTMPTTTTEMPDTTTPPSYPAYDTPYKTCNNERTNMGKTEIRMIPEGEKYTIPCPVKQSMFCRWFHNNMEMPSAMGGVAVTSTGNLRFKSATWSQSGQYTLDLGNHYITYHIIVMPTNVVEMTIDIPSNRMVQNMEFRNMYWYNLHVKNVVFENVKFVNMHWQMMWMENVKFVNCSFHWDADTMYPMQAQFKNCAFEMTAWNRVHMRDSSFKDCSFTDGYHVDNDMAEENKYYTFFQHHIHNTVFCDISWKNTHWESGKWYNTTFNLNIFTQHKQYNEDWQNFHYMVIDCTDFRAETDTMVQWTRDEEGNCYMLIHRNDAKWYDEEACKKYATNKMKKYVCGHDVSSTRFWGCTFEECSWEHVYMQSIEWRHVMHHKSSFARCEMMANHFVMTHHTNCRWMQMKMKRWNRFTANSFSDHWNHWIAATDVTHHSCQFHRQTWDCRNCKKVSFQHCMMESVMMEPTCSIGVWNMQDCSTLGMTWQGTMETYRYCRVHHNDNRWMTNFALNEYVDACDMDYAVQHSEKYHCMHNPHDQACAHWWMDPSWHCCYGKMSCHMMPHQFWQRDNMECRANDYDFSWRMGEWRDNGARDRHYREWSTSEYDPHSWSTHHKMPMVHCMAAMKQSPHEYSMTLRTISYNYDDYEALPETVKYMKKKYSTENPRYFYKSWQAKRTQFHDHWNCIYMFKY